MFALLMLFLFFVFCFCLFSLFSFFVIVHERESKMTGLCVNQSRCSGSRDCYSVCFVFMFLYHPNSNLILCNTFVTNQVSGVLLQYRQTDKTRQKNDKINKKNHKGIGDHSCCDSRLRVLWQHMLQGTIATPKYQQ